MKINCHFYNFEGLNSDFLVISYLKMLKNAQNSKFRAVKMAKISLQNGFHVKSRVAGKLLNFQFSTLCVMSHDVFRPKSLTWRFHVKLHWFAMTSIFSKSAICELHFSWLKSNFKQVLPHFLTFLEPTKNCCNLFCARNFKM